MSEQQNTKPKSVMIATPMYGGQCYGSYVRGLIYTIANSGTLGVNISWTQMTNESLITRARNELARIFLEQGHDYLLFIDADIGFDHEAVAALLKADKDVVCGIYPKKEVNWESVERAARSGRTGELSEYAGAFVFNVVDDRASATTDSTGCVEVRHGGTGFMLIKRRVFEVLADHVPSYRVSSYTDPETGEYHKPLTKEFFATSIDDSGALLSEDFHFCELWREHGGSIWAFPFARLTHTGTYTYDGNILKSGGNLK